MNKLLRSHASSNKEHCPQGHEYYGDNLSVDKHGHRTCKACKRHRAASARQKKKAEAEYMATWRAGGISIVLDEQRERNGVNCWRAIYRKESLGFYDTPTSATHAVRSARDAEQRQFIQDNPYTRVVKNKDATTRKWVPTQGKIEQSRERALSKLASFHAQYKAAKLGWYDTKREAELAIIDARTADHAQFKAETANLNTETPQPTLDTNNDVFARDMELAQNMHYYINEGDEKKV